MPNQKIIIVEENQYGVFTQESMEGCSQHIRIITPASQLAIILYHRPTKKCLIINAPRGVDCARIHDCIRQSLPGEDLTQYHTVLAGICSDSESNLFIANVKILLTSLGIASITADRFMPEGVTGYNTGITIFAPHNGMYAVNMHSDEENPQVLDSTYKYDVRSQCSIEFTRSCIRYRKYISGITPRALTLQLRLNPDRPDLAAGHEIIKYYKNINPCSTSRPLIPWKLEEEVEAQLLWLALYGQRTNVNLTEFFKKLFGLIINPVSKIKVLGRDYTPLHYIFFGLKSHHGNAVERYKYEAMGFMTLLFGRRDLPNWRGKVALDYLPESEYKRKCRQMISIFDDCQKRSDDETFIKQMCRVYNGIIGGILDGITTYEAAIANDDVRMAETVQVLLSELYVGMDCVVKAMREMQNCFAAQPTAIPVYFSLLPGSYGTFTIDNTRNTNGLIGGGTIGRKCLLFVHDVVNKRCLAINMPEYLQPQTIINKVDTFLGGDFKPDYYKAYISGCWFAARSEELEQSPVLQVKRFLQSRAIQNVHTENLTFILGGTDSEIGKYQVVFFDLNKDNMPLTVIEDLRCAPSGMSFVPFQDPDAEHVGRCADYLKSNSQLYANAGMPLIPSRASKAIMSEWIDKLIAAVTAADVRVVLSVLASAYFNPVSLHGAKESVRTPLHAACQELAQRTERADSDTYKLELIVLLILLHGKRDVMNAARQQALDMLPDSIFKDGCIRLRKLFVAFINTPDSAQRTTIMNDSASSERQLVADYFAYEAASAANEPMIYTFSDRLETAIENLARIFTPSRLDTTGLRSSRPI